MTDQKRLASPHAFLLIACQSSDEEVHGVHLTPRGPLLELTTWDVLLANLLHTNVGIRHTSTKHRIREARHANQAVKRSTVLI